MYPVISVATCATDVLKVLGRNIRSPAAIRSSPYARRNWEEQRWTSTSFVGVPAKFRTVHLLLPKLQPAGSSVVLCGQYDGVPWVVFSYERSEWTAILRHCTGGVQLSRGAGLSVRLSIVLASRVVPRVSLSVPPSPVDMLQETLRGGGRLKWASGRPHSVAGLCVGRLNWKRLHRICVAA